MIVRFQFFIQCPFYSFFLFCGLTLLFSAAGDPAHAAAFVSPTLRATAARLNAGHAITPLPILIRIDAANGSPAPGALPDARQISQSQAGLTQKLKSLKGWRLRGHLTTIPWLVGEIDASSLHALAQMPGVIAIGSVPQVRATLAQSTLAIRAKQARIAYGADGSGAVAGIIDTGLDLSHPDLQNAVAAGIHFLDDGTSDTNVQDDNGHGTYMSGIITSDGVVAAAGVAPASRLLVVKAINSQLSGTLAGVIRGLDWLVANKPNFPALRFVNMSFSISLSRSECPCDALATTEPAYQAFLDAVARARAAEIWCIASAGNGGSGSMTAPSCFSGVISVGASYDTRYTRAPTTNTYQTLDPKFPACFDANVSTDTFGCYSSRLPCLTFLAPGYLITSDKLGGGTRNSFGTSASAAHVTGGLALLSSILPQYSNAQLIYLLQTTAKPVADPVAPTHVYGRIDLLAAVRRAHQTAVRNGWPLY